MTTAMLTQIGVAKALRSIAAITAGIHDPDQALDWAVRQGFIAHRSGAARDVITLTERGCAVVWIFWRAYQTGRKADRGERVDETPWGHA